MPDLSNAPRPSGTRRAWFPWPAAVATSGSAAGEEEEEATPALPPEEALAATTKPAARWSEW